MQVRTAIGRFAVLMASVVLLVAAAVTPALAAPSGATVYWSDSGSDANTGLDATAPVKTWAKVSELLEQNADVTTVALTGTVTLSDGTQVVPSRNVTITRTGDNKKFTMFWVADGASVTFDNVTIDGAVVSDASTHTVDATDGFMVLLGQSSTVNLGSSAVLENNGNSAVVLNGNGATLNVNGATFKNNAATYGAAVAASFTSTVNVNAGTFENNHASYFGGAIMLSGGTNTSGEVAKQTLNVTGSAGKVVFSNNSAAGGGAIYVNVDTDAKIERATFTGNNAEVGGAIYVVGNTNGNHGTLSLGSTLLTGNTATGYGTSDASLAGGGIYSCPTSKLSLNVEKGYKIFGNTSSDIAIDGDSQPFWGDELAGSEPSFLVSSRAADGTDSSWTKLQGSESSVSAYLDHEVTLASGDRVALKSANGTGVTDPAAYDVVLSGNTAAVGGAIANNGTATIGGEGIDVSVRKAWDDEGKADGRPAYITVSVYAGSSTEPVQTVRLGATADAAAGVVAADVSEDGSWSYVFKNLPAVSPDGSAITYRVEEEKVDGYLDPVVAGDQATGFTITNTVEPDEPVNPDPVEPTEPSEPSDPTPSEPSEPTPSEPTPTEPSEPTPTEPTTASEPTQPAAQPSKAAPSAPKVPNTGDETSFSAIAPLAVLGVAALGLGAAVQRRRQGPSRR